MAARIKSGFCWNLVSKAAQSPSRADFCSSLLTDNTVSHEEIIKITVWLNWNINYNILIERYPPVDEGSTAGGFSSLVDEGSTAGGFSSPWWLADPPVDYWDSNSTFLCSSLCLINSSFNSALAPLELCWPDPKITIPHNFKSEKKLDTCYQL